jgi:hypothetical protein
VPEARWLPMAEQELAYVTHPTRWTLFLRTFLPWQVWRFVWINLKMIRMVRWPSRAR